MIQIFLNINQYSHILFFPDSFTVLNYLSNSIIFIDNDFLYNNFSISFNSFISNISYLLFFFILEPEWEAIFYSCSYYGRYQNYNSCIILDFDKNFSGNYNSNVCFLKFINMLSILQSKSIILKGYSFNLDKYIIYYFYKINRELYFYFPQKQYFWRTLNLRSNYLKIFSFLILNIFLNSFDFCVALFFLKEIRRLFCFYVRFAFLFLFISNNFLLSNSIIHKMQRLLLFDYKVFTFNSLFISNLYKGFTFLGFNFSISESFDNFKLMPSKYSILYFLKFYKDLVYSNMIFMKFYSCKGLREVIKSILIILILNLRALVFNWMFYYKSFGTFSDSKKILNFLFFKTNSIILNFWFRRIKSKNNLFYLKKKYFPQSNRYLFQNKIKSNKWIFCTKYRFTEKIEKVLFIPKLSWLLFF
uniref:Group II intron reverse transcriptase/maturase mat4 n=1 Tax=Eutreptia sp. CCAC 1914B TaxID=2979827 RepID=A0A977PJA3_9EUGL|nr:putative group II intron reverse transcriptase/maturase mat4 [Eutreptia sp. CCAC 1914B]